MSWRVDLVLYGGSAHTLRCTACLRTITQHSRFSTKRSKELFEETGTTQIALHNKSNFLSHVHKHT